jgi:hypothetical protein
MWLLEATDWPFTGKYKKWREELQNSSLVDAKVALWFKIWSWALERVKSKRHNETSNSNRRTWKKIEKNERWKRCSVTKSRGQSSWPSQWSRKAIKGAYLRNK